MVKKTTKLDKKDLFRALLTDTTPGDVPIIFSNDGFYINCHSYQLTHRSTDHKIFKSIFDNLLRSGSSQSTPYKYSIRKNETALRGLSLIHPRAQLNFTTFYHNYSDVIVYLCSQSMASIRSPYKVSNRYFSRDLDTSSRYKEIDIDTLENELARKHSSSYFSYRGHNRLYKLFSSDKYIYLEKHFESFWTLDIANCFNSIYTHVISWAIKNKKYIRENIDHRNQFCNDFDQLMQRSNNNETNGIPIGAEVNRIFAEVILQSIDNDTVAKLSLVHGVEFGKDYVFYRYVDDYAVFSKSEGTSQKITECLSDCLSEYRLYLNDQKIRKYIRPFNTEKSVIISTVKERIQEFENKILESYQHDDIQFKRPKNIRNKSSLIRYFVGEVKRVCSTNTAGYGDVSSYLISTLSNRVDEVISGYCVVDDSNRKLENIKYKDTIYVILKLMFFFYKVYPQVTTSYKLAKTIVIVDRFFDSESIDFCDYFRTLIMEEVQDITFTLDSDSARTGFVSLEDLNILLATSDFGSNYLLAEDKLEGFLVKSSRASYFTLISLIYYIRDHSQYNSLRKSVEHEIIKKFDSCSNLASDSELVHLFLDSLSCPYLSRKTKSTILKNYLEHFEAEFFLDDVSTVEALQKLEKVYWFVKWRKLDLIKLLERSQLNNIY